MIPLTSSLVPVKGEDERSSDLLLVQMIVREQQHVEFHLGCAEEKGSTVVLSVSLDPVGALPGQSVARSLTQLARPDPATVDRCCAHYLGEATPHEVGGDVDVDVGAVSVAQAMQIGDAAVLVDAVFVLSCGCCCFLAAFQLPWARSCTAADIVPGSVQMLCARSYSSGAVTAPRRRQTSVLSACVCERPLPRETACVLLVAFTSDPSHIVFGEFAAAEGPSTARRWQLRKTGLLAFRTHADASFVSYGVTHRVQQLCWCQEGPWDSAVHPHPFLAALHITSPLPRDPAASELSLMVLEEGAGGHTTAPDGVVVLSSSSAAFVEGRWCVRSLTPAFDSCFPFLFTEPRAANGSPSASSPSSASAALSPLLFGFFTRDAQTTGEGDEGDAEPRSRFVVFSEDGEEARSAALHGRVLSAVAIAVAAPHPSKTAEHATRGVAVLLSSSLSRPEQLPKRIAFLAVSTPAAGKCRVSVEGVVPVRRGHLHPASLGETEEVLDDPVSLLSAYGCPSACSQDRRWWCLSAVLLAERDNSEGARKANHTDGSLPLLYTSACRMQARMDSEHVVMSAVQVLAEPRPVHSRELATAADASCAASGLQWWLVAVTREAPEALRACGMAILRDGHVVSWAEDGLVRHAGFITVDGDCEDETKSVVAALTPLLAYGRPGNTQAVAIRVAPRGGAADAGEVAVGGVTALLLVLSYTQARWYAAVVAVGGPRSGLVWHASAPRLSHLTPPTSGPFPVAALVTPSPEKGVGSSVTFTYAFLFAGWAAAGGAFDGSEKSSPSPSPSSSAAAAASLHGWCALIRLSVQPYASQVLLSDGTHEGESREGRVPLPLVTLDVLEKREYTLIAPGSAQGEDVTIAADSVATGVPSVVQAELSVVGEPTGRRPSFSLAVCLRAEQQGDVLVSLGP